MLTISGITAQEAYERKVFVSPSGDSLNYRLLRPEQIKKGEKYPLVLFLHGAGERGSDIVCAALSAVSQTALLGLTRVIKAPVKFERDDEKGFLHVTVNTDNEDVRRRTDDVLNTMLCGIKDMAEGYPQFIKLEEKNHVY